MEEQVRVECIAQHFDKTINAKRLVGEQFVIGLASADGRVRQGLVRILERLGPRKAIGQAPENKQSGGPTGHKLTMPLTETTPHGSDTLPPSATTPQARPFVPPGADPKLDTLDVEHQRGEALVALTRDQLREVAKGHGLTGYGHYDKDQLIDAVLEHEFGT